MTQQELKQAYNRQNWQTWLQEIFGVQVQFEIQAETINIDSDNIKSIERFASINLLDGKNLAVLDIGTRKEVQIARNRVRLRNLVEKFIDHARYHGILAFYHNSVMGEYRMSFISSEPTIDADGNFSIQSTAPKRFTYVLGENQKTKTPADRLKVIADKHGKATLEDIRNAFSVETLNKEFYKIVAKHFYQLVGATEGKGSKAITYNRMLQLPSVNADDNRTKSIYQEFAVRLIGRTVFCWFLKKKKPINGESLLPENLLSSKAVKENSGYYHSILERLFFQTLNTPMGKRIVDLPAGCEHIPFLNGGLFEPQKDDYYLPNKFTGLSNHINTLKIPDDWFYDFFTNLEQYNFTIDENSMTDVEVSVDPEILGRIFENLLAEIDPDSGDSARNATGSFYTPREIVDYMVQESLIAYLKNELLNEKSANESELENNLIQLFNVNEENPFDKENTQKLLLALDSLKILDPACGSGAFPMGVLQKIVMVLQKLDPNAEWWKNKQVEKIDNVLLRNMVKQKLEQTTVEYARKIGIIQNSLYGVDIQPIAAEISKLRCFLTLIVDENIDDNKPNRGVEPLPNLEFKFVTANSLLQLPEEKDFGGLWNFNNELNKLQKIRLEYLQSYGEEKDALKEQFLTIQNDIYQQQIKLGGAVDLNGRAYKISVWNPFNHEKTDWFDHEWMFGLKQENVGLNASGFFDIVIGNPPYVSTRNMDISIKADLKNFYILAQGQYDLFILFIEKASQLLNQKGIFSFIIPKKILTNENFTLARKFLLKNLPVKIYLDAQMPFEAAAVEANVIISTRAQVDFVKTFLFKNGSICFVFDVNVELINSMPFNIFPFSINPNNISLLDSILHKTKRKLGDYVNIIRGMECGFNHTSISKSYGNFKIIKGEHIDKYLIKPTEWSVVPNMCEKEVIKSETIYQTTPKLVTKFVSNSLDFALDEIGYYNTNVVYNVIIKNEFQAYLKFLLGLCNSKLINFWFFNTYVNDDKLFPHIQKNQLDSIPIILTNDIKPFDVLVNQILCAKQSDPSADTSALEREIDWLVYALYGLTDEEIGVIEK